MNSLVRLKQRLLGEAVDRPPNFDILMNLAAHHIGQPLASYYHDHRVLVDANLSVLEAFDLDIVQAISDPFREAADFGLEVEFPADNLPINRKPLLVEPEDIKKLVTPDPATGPRMSDRVEAVRLFRERVGGEVPIMGWVEGALAEAADLRSVYLTMTDLVRRPEWLEELLEICVNVEIAFARAQVQAGADIIGLGDAVASQISPAMYRRFGLPYEKRIFAAVHEMGALTRLHICGNTTRILPDMMDSGADIIDLDWMVDFGAAAEVLGNRAAICGNQDPVTVMLDGTPEQVRRITLKCMTVGGPRSISAAGCEIPDGTPHRNLRAQAQALRQAAG
ncbi:MAG: uroporphyrinogen decarboxylase [Anaerolineales bacterium]|nr:uroporphyrinogen decarboxylase [Anaerolineales bacterium]